MCDLLTFAVPVGATLPATLKYERRSALMVQPFRNEAGGHDYGPGYDSYAVLVGSCSCGLVAIGESPDDRERDPERLQRKYRRKGWSQAKIERAIHQHQAHVAHAGDQWRGIRPDVAGYLRDICDTCGEVRFIAHRHSGSFVSEEFSLSGRETITPDALTAGVPTLQHDHLYVVRNEHSKGRVQR